MLGSLELWLAESIYNVIIYHIVGISIGVFLGYRR